MYIFLAIKGYKLTVTMVRNSVLLPQFAILKLQLSTFDCNVKPCRPLNFQH